jgi:hypothetical protein
MVQGMITKLNVGRDIVWDRSSKKGGDALNRAP